jgi:endonuclease YncB( thermonuclease family)
MKTLALFITALLTLSTSALGAPEYGSVIVSEVRSIYDADTFKVHIEGWPDIIGKSVSIRVNGVDAAEMRGKCESEKLAAREAKQFTVAQLRQGKVIELRNMKRGKYFRILADVYIDDVNLADQLIAAGLARPYDGSKRLSWCD